MSLCIIPDTRYQPKPTPKKQQTVTQPYLLPPCQTSRATSNTIPIPIPIQCPRDVPLPLTCCEFPLSSAFHPDNLNATNASTSLTPGLIVLDLDQTLIDDVSQLALVPSVFLPAVFSVPVLSGRVLESTIVVERPHLELFLNFLFSKFTHVAIWSRASDDWVKSVVSLSPTLSRFAPRFSFIWSEAKCTTSLRSRWYPGEVKVTHKPLKKIWRKAIRRRLPGISAHNTVLIDDTPENARENYGNYIFVPAFEVESSSEAIVSAAGAAADEWLERLTRYLDVAVLPAMRCGTVRTLEKRGWHHRRKFWGSTGSAGDDDGESSAITTLLSPSVPKRMSIKEECHK